MTNTAPLNGQIPPYALLALILTLAAIGRLDPETLAALSAAAGLAQALNHNPRTGP